MFSETPLIRECGWTHQDSYMLEESVLDSPGLRDLLKKNSDKNVKVFL